VSGRADIFQLLAGENVNGNEMDLSMTVLAGLGCGHVDDLARATLDHDMSVFAKSRALHGERRGCSCTRLLKCLIVGLIIGHFR